MNIKLIYYIIIGIISLNSTAIPPSSNIKIPNEINLNVPFTSQAPFENWDMPYQEACEEASIIMVKHYLDQEKLTKDIADKEIHNLVQWQTAHGYKEDINAAETIKIAKDFYQLSGELFYDQEVTITKIKELLAQGNPVIIPASGQTLNNPYYNDQGPPYHMIVITGYDDQYFYTNDPGTKNGENFKYSYQTIEQAIHDWTGSKESIDQGPKAMLIITK